MATKPELGTRIKYLGGDKFEEVKPGTIGTIKYVRDMPGPFFGTWRAYTDVEGFDPSERAFENGMVKTLEEDC